jgi:hypothetical protein
MKGERTRGAADETSAPSAFFDTHHVGIRIVTDVMIILEGQLSHYLRARPD